MTKPTSIRLSEEADKALEDLRKRLGSRWSRPSVSKVISMILTREIDLNEYPLAENIKKEIKN
jgi:predicted DNA-binding protein